MFALEYPLNQRCMCNTLSIVLLGDLRQRLLGRKSYSFEANLERPHNLPFSARGVIHSSKFTYSGRIPGPSGGVPVLRFYGWKPELGSLGFNPVRMSSIDCC